MIKYSNKFSLLIVCLLFIQLITPYTQVFANDIEPPERFWHKIENGNAVTLYWQADSKISEYHLYQIENGNRKLLLSKKASQYKMTDLPEGDYNFEVVSYSEEFGESSPITLSFDLVYPVIQAPIGLAASVQNGNDIMLTWKQTEFATSYEVYKVGGDEKELVGTVNTTRFVSENMPEGQYAYEIYAVSERFGKSANSGNVEYTLTHPTMEAPSTGYARIDNLNDLVVYWKSDDLATEYYLYQVIDGEDQLIEKRTINNYKTKVNEGGDLVYKIRTYSDRFGLSAKAFTVTLDSVELNLNTPELTLKWFDGQKAVLGWNVVRYSDSYNLYEIVDGREEFVQSTTGTTVTLDGLEIGPHQFVVRAVNDTIGESASSNAVSFEVRFDIKVPITTTNTTSYWTNKDVTVDLTATDDKSGVDTTFYILGNDESAELIEGNTFAISGEGIWNYSYYSIDLAGNAENPKNDMVRIDKTPPVTTSNATDGWHDTFRVQLTAEDNLSGILTSFISINGGDFRSGNMIYLSQKGEYTISYYSMDKAGNKEPVQNVQLKINGVEKPEEEIPLLEGTGLKGDEVEELLGFIGKDPAKIEELTALEHNHPLPTWDSSQKNEQLPQIEDFLNGLKEIMGVEVNIKTGENESVTIDELIAMDEINSDIIIEITTPDGELIGDIVLPAETPEEQPVENSVENPITNEPSNQVPIVEIIDVVRDEETQVYLQEEGDSSQTVDGAKLPQTASNMLLNILLGLGMMLIGSFVFLKNVKNSKGGFSK